MTDKTWIELPKNWVITNDAYQYIVGPIGTRPNRKTEQPEDYVREPRFFPNIDDCLNCWFKHHVRESGSKDFDEYLANTKELTKELRAKVPGVTLTYE